MRLGILSDIHSNYNALTASYKALTNGGCDKIICAGDVVGYGAKPAECIDFLREHDIQTVKGNHDNYTVCKNVEWNIQPYAIDAIKWTQDHLSQDCIDWLDSLPFAMRIENVTVVHASLEAVDGEYWPYILDTKSALFHFFLQETRFAFFGHTHIPLLFTYDESRRISIEILRSKTLSQTDDSKYLLNPGSVGQPRDFDARSASVIFDTASGKLEMLRTMYDVSGTQEEIIAAGLPRILATRLSRGN